MSAPVATLMIEMAADVSRLRKDMDQAKGMVGGAMNEISKAADFAKKALIGMAVGFVTHELVGMVKGALDAADALDDVAKRTGVSASQLSALVAVGRTTGTTAETIAGAMTKLAKNMVDVDKPTSNAGQALKALGIHVEDFKKLKPDEQMLEVAKAAEKFADGGGKAAAMEAIMGKGAAALIPYMKDLAGTQKLQAEMTDEQAAAANAFNDNLTEIRAASGGWAKEIANGMAPALAMASKAFLDAFTNSTGLREGLKKLVADGTIERWTKSAITGLSYVLDGVAYLKRAFEVVGQAILNGFYAISSVVTGVGTAFQKMARGDFSGAVSAITGSIKDAAQIMKDFGKLAVDIWSEDTLGAKMRARMKDLEGVKFAISDAGREQVRFAGDTDKATEAAKKHAAAQKEVEQAISATSIKQIEMTKTVVDTSAAVGEAAKAFAAEVERANEWQKTVDSVFNGLTDALFRAFEDGKGFMLAFRDTLVNTFKTLVLQPTIQAVMRPIAGAIGGMFSGTAGAGTGGAGSALGLLGSLGSMGGMFGSGVSYGLSGAFGSLGSTLSGSMSMIGGGIAGGSAGSALAGLGGMVGALGPYVALAYMAYQFANSAWEDGFRGGGLPGLSAGNLMKYGGPLGMSMIWGTKPVDSLLKGLGVNEKWAGILSGSAAMSKLFGLADPVVKQQGFDLTASEGGISGNAFAKMFYKGGWFRSNQWKTKTSDMPDDVSLSLGLQADAIYQQISAYAGAVGLPVEALKNVTTQMRVQLGKTDEETAANIQAFFDKYREDLTANFATALEPFQQAGETLAETLQRLVGIQAMSEQLNQFGGIFSKIAALSVDAREELIGFAGGIEALLGKVQSFVGAYYSEGEQTAIAAKQIRDALGAMGISADVSSKSDFRALVEAQDISTTEGRKQLDALLTLSATFAPVAEYLGKAGVTLSQLADQAPQSELLQSIFDAGQVQGEVATRTADGVDRVNDSVVSIGDQITTAVGEMKAELTASLVAVAAATQQTANQLARWDYNGQLSTTTDVP